MGLRVALAFAVLVAFVLVVLFVMQRRLIYFPDPSAPHLPETDARAGLEEVVIPVDDGVRLRAWHRPAPPGAETVLLFHGNAGHRGTRLPLIMHLVEVGLGVLALDYRGYGGSTGTPTEAGLYEDATAAVGWLEGRGARDLIYFGESLGTGVAVELGTRPIERGRRLFERAREPKRFVAIEGAGHNDLRQTGASYFGPLDRFLREEL